MGRFVEKVREASLRWFVLRKNAWYNIGRRMLADERADRKEETGTLKMRSIDAVREDMSAMEVTEEDTEERTEWRRRIAALFYWYRTDSSLDTTHSHSSQRRRQPPNPRDANQTILG